jgi:hypothetical protein
MLSRSAQQYLRNSAMRRTQMVAIPQRSFARKSEMDGNTMNSGLINLGFAVFVREKYAVLVHRLQKFDRLMKPGLNFKIPFIDTIEYVHDLREQVVEISS